VLAPLLREVGERWHQGTLTIAEEHLVSQSAKQRLLSLLQSAPRRAKHHVVCACMPDDDHELGLFGTALRFRHAGWRVTFLGARTPIEHLARVVSAVAPEVVALAATHDPGAREFKEGLEALVAALPKGTRLIVGGYASEKHAAIVLQVGAEKVPTPEGWQQLLG
jgi:methanogenic corrinoid protein MtbC1